MMLGRGWRLERPLELSWPQLLKEGEGNGPGGLNGGMAKRR